MKHVMRVLQLCTYLNNALFLGEKCGILELYNMLCYFVRVMTIIIHIRTININSTTFFAIFLLVRLSAVNIVEKVEFKLDNFYFLMSTAFGFFVFKE